AAGPPPVEPGVTPAEVQRMFDAYALMQAQEQLNIGEGQFSTFLTRFKGLQDIAARGAEEERKAYDAIDQVLDVRQQAKFRIFEEVMERRKLELVARARQANRPKNQR